MQVTLLNPSRLPLAKSHQAAIIKAATSSFDAGKSSVYGAEVPLNKTSTAICNFEAGQNRTASILSIETSK
jgi:hypothetical protein